MPNPEEEEEALGRQRRRRQQPVAASLSLLIEAHPLVLQHLASSPGPMLVTCRCARPLFMLTPSALIGGGSLIGSITGCVVNAGA